MSSYAPPIGSGGSGGSGGTVGSPNMNRRRRVINCDAAALTEDVAVSKFFAPLADTSDIQRSTVCMDYHVLARFEDDVRRAEMRLENPESAMPTRGYDYEMEAQRAVDEYYTTQQLPNSSRANPSGAGPSARGDNFLPALTPQSSRSRRGSASRSRHHSRSGSVANSPSTRHRAGAPSSTRKGGAARLSPYQTPSPSKADGAARVYEPRYPGNGRLEPLDTGRGTPSRQRDSGRHGDAAPPHKQLLLEATSLDAQSGAEAASDTGRERRLRLAEELAARLETAEL
ncbi:hypothetical protein NESM_000204000 [Novymonas esmeraldas]|uniref:Uncharacterized protein n=1 Tax=Novymonas esmeraldas TaxID=1808958 RepID=A0AAW0F4C2_9TRYP